MRSGGPWKGDRASLGLGYHRRMSFTAPLRLFIPLFLLCSGIPSVAIAERKPPNAPVALEVALVGRYSEGTQEILAFEAKSALLGVAAGDTVRVEQPAGRPLPYASILGPSGPGRPPLILIRRQLPPVGEKQSVLLSPRSVASDAPAQPAYRFLIGDTAATKSDPQVKRQWLESLRADLNQVQNLWSDFARLRIDALLREMEQPASTKTGLKARHGSRPRVGVTEPVHHGNDQGLVQMMDTTMGFASVREALQIDRQLRTQYASEKPSVALASIAGPSLAQHPWKALSATLGKTAPDEPLARVVPATFYYVRFASLGHLFRLLDEADAWITPVATLTSNLSQDQGLAKRYEAQLGLQRGLASRLLGPQVVQDLAVVGSDPYLREGSDLTFIFRVKNQTAFAAGLAGALAGHLAAHGPQASQTVDYAGLPIAITRSQDGEVRQHRVQVGDMVLVSNSLGATQAVLDCMKGKSATLADEPDFRYFTARDAAVPADVLAFMGDAFVAEVVGPRQKILEARRMVALSDLLAPGNAALLYGWMFGQTPTRVDQLVAANLLGKDELAHVTGEAITWAPGSAARSSWGQVAAMTPLIDLPAPKHVTASERDAYRRFAESYQRNWSTYMDPAALRLAFDAAGKGALKADLRVLPIIDASEYRKMQHTVGEARIHPATRPSGAMLALGVGQDAELRRMVTSMSRDMPFPLRAQLDWLGSVAFLGLDDRFDGKTILDLSNRDHRVPEQEWLRLFVEAPVHAGIGVRNRLTAAVTLGALRKMLQDAAPGAIDWREKGKHRGTPYVVVGAAREGDVRRFAGDIKLYYAFCKDYLLLSLGEATLKARIDDCLDGKLAQPAEAQPKAGRQPPQLAMALAMKKNGPLWTLASLALQDALAEAQPASRSEAAVLVCGTPDLTPSARRALSLAYWGRTPTDADGADLLGEPGIEHALPWRHPRRQIHALPRDGSIVARVLGAMAKASSEIGFDEEPRIGQEDIRSLHIVLSLGGP
jgi:hypothetical protein